jgi:hypothetical protein
MIKMFSLQAILSSISSKFREHKPPAIRIRVKQKQKQNILIVSVLVSKCVIVIFH